MNNMNNAGRRALNLLKPFFLVGLVWFGVGMGGIAGATQNFVPEAIAHGMCPANCPKASSVLDNGDERLHSYEAQLEISENNPQNTNVATLVDIPLLNLQTKTSPQDSCAYVETVYGAKNNFLVNGEMVVMNGYRIKFCLKESFDNGAVLFVDARKITNEGVFSFIGELRVVRNHNAIVALTDDTSGDKGVKHNLRFLLK